MPFEVGPVLEQDEAAINEICFLNYDRGPQPRFRELAPLRWLVPYLRYEGEHCLVVRDTGASGSPAVGYVICAPNAADFRRRFSGRMKKELRRALGRVRREFSAADFITQWITFVRYPDAMPRRQEPVYPAHLHINVHPGYYSRGLGTMLLDGLMEHLKSIGCPGVHLGVGSSNRGAIRFYERYGFTLLRRMPGVIYYGCSIGERRMEG